ncbi:MAG: helix-turn-helix domain-containing protein [Gallionella sp.]|nr:hypothetical protein [Gallionella sp.]
MKNNQDIPKNKAAGLPTQTAQNNHLNAHDTSLINQQAIVLSALQKEAQHTASLRNDYGVMHPAARVQELRERGYRIDTVRVSVITPDGVKHRSVAKYFLQAINNAIAGVMP